MTSHSSLTKLGVILCVAGVATMIAGGAATQIVGRPAAETSPLPSGPFDSLTVDQKKQYLGKPEQQKIAAAAEKGTPAANPSIAPMPPERPWPTGILTASGPPPLPQSEFVGLNVWAGVVNNLKVLVYAGGKGNDGPSAQGVILVWLFPTDAGVLKQYPTPTAHGFVRVVSAAGSQVTLQTASGTRYAFDISTSKFI